MVGFERLIGRVGADATQAGGGRGSEKGFELRDAAVDVLHGAAVRQIARQQILTVEAQTDEILLGGGLDVEIDLAGCAGHLSRKAGELGLGFAQGSIDAALLVGEFAEQAGGGVDLCVEIAEVVGGEIVAQRLVGGVQPALDDAALFGEAIDAFAGENLAAIGEIFLDEGVECFGSKFRLGVRERQAQDGRAGRGGCGEICREGFEGFLVHAVGLPFPRTQTRFSERGIESRHADAANGALGDHGRVREFGLGLENLFLLREGAARGIADNRIEDVFLAQPDEQARVGRVFCGRHQRNRDADQKDRHENEHHQPLGPPELKQRIHNPELRTEPSSAHGRGCSPGGAA